MGKILLGLSTVFWIGWFIWPLVFVLSFAIFLRSIIVDPDQASVKAALAAWLSLTVIISGLAVH